MRPQVIALLSLLAVACGPDRDPITANRVLGAGDETATRQFDADSEREALETMRETLRATIAGAEPISAAPARHGVRWSDVRDAVRLACIDCELAVVATETSEDRLRFTMVNVRDEPAELIVERRPPPQVVAATATVGSFGQHPDEASMLVATFDRILRALGRKPGFE